MCKIEKINIVEKFDLFDEIRVPRIAAELSDDDIKLDKFHGEFPWHKHDEEDELFLVVC